MLGVQFSFWRGLTRQGSIRTGHFGILYSQISQNSFYKKLPKLRVLFYSSQKFAY